MPPPSPLPAPSLRLLRRALPFLLVLLLATGALVLGIFWGRRQVPTPPTRLEVAVLDVGQGEAGFIRTPTGRFIVIGAGPPESAKRVVAALKEAGAQRIDLLILPYPYGESLGGASELLSAFPVGQVMEGGGDPINDTQRDLRRRLWDDEIPVRIVRDGDTIPVGKLKIEVLAPAEPLLARRPAAPNNSLVLRFVWGETRFLWAGGLDKAGEEALLGRLPNIEAQWLRIARSGNDAASSSEFLRLVSPEIAVLSVGPNRYGFPHPAALERLQASGARLFRTDIDGDLHFFSDGVTITGP